MFDEPFESLTNLIDNDLLDMIYNELKQGALSMAVEPPWMTNTATYPSRATNEAIDYAIDFAIHLDPQNIEKPCVLSCLIDVNQAPDAAPNSLQTTDSATDHYMTTAAISYF